MNNKFENTEIHPTSIIEDGAVIGSGTKIGPWCIVGKNAIIGENNILKSNVIIDGNTTIGNNNLIHQFVIIGNKSHDLKWTAEQATSVTIGNNCDIREYTNIHAGTPLGKPGTIIGNNVFIMSHSHIGHDCIVKDFALLSQATTLGGEVIISEHAIIGGCSAVHQFCTIGKYSIIGGCSKITQDVIPFAMSDGNPQELNGLNLIGLKRNNFTDEEIRIIKEIYKILFITEGYLWQERIEIAKSLYETSKVGKEIFNFISADAKRIICKPKRKITV